MRVLNALQLKNGAKANPITKSLSLTQPTQFLSQEDKDDEWFAQCIDWYETQGIRQIRRNGKHLLKNIRLAKGIIERSDYIVEEDNEYAGLLDKLTDEDASAYELKFYPIIPTAIRFLKTKFAERTSKLTFDAQDDLSKNEQLEAKIKEIEKTLLAQAEQKMMQNLIDQGMDPNSDEAQQQLSPDNLKTLPEIEEFFKKDYRSEVALWAMHQTHVDEKRFSMRELETEAFEHSLTVSREFWHFKMLEDDYELELWNPLFTFFHKSPGKRYISQANYVGNVEMMSISDIIDTYGYLMDEDELESLEQIAPRQTGLYSLTGIPNDGSMYDQNKSYKWNTEGPGLAMRQLNDMTELANNQDIIQWMNSDSDDFMDFGNKDLIRKTTVYWRTQRKLYHLTQISSTGELISKIVTEDYKVTDKPQYNTILNKAKSADNLIFGEHLDCIWINEVVGGIRIGPNTPGASNLSANKTFEPIYLGIDNKRPSRLKFQFKGDYSLYGCKLPVEGRVFADENTKAVGLVDLMKPHQIGFNLVNNQAADILVDELGTVVLIDQNGLPKESMGEDWGPNNFSKAYAAMKQFQMLPLDTSTRNVEGGMNFNQWGTKLDLSQTERLKSRLDYARYFKEEALSVIGITQQALGEISPSSSATGTQQSVQASATMTEMYFIQHSDWLMPRVHQMRTDLAQYYHSNNPSIHLQYITSLDEKINFRMNTTNLLSRDIHVYATTEVNARAILDQLKQYYTQTNQIASNLADMGSVLRADSISEMNIMLKRADEKIAAQRKAEQDHETQLEQMRIDAENQKIQEAQQFEAKQNDLDRRTKIQESLIRSAGMPSTDVQKDGQDDYMQKLDFIQKNTQFQDKLNMEREKEVNKTSLETQKINLKQQELRSREQISKDNLQVAITNKNYMDKKAAQKPKPKK